MFDPTRIRNEFMGLAGIPQNDNPNFPQLASNLLYTGSNILIDHPLVNIENLDMCCRNYGQFLYPAYAPGTDYGVDTNQTMVRVLYASKAYRSKVTPNIGHQPDTSPTQWEEINLLSAYIENLFGSAHVDVVNQVFNKKQINLNIKTPLRNLRLYDGAGNLNDRVVNEGALVGLEIQLRYNQNIVAVIEKIGLQLTAAQTLTMYLYHSSQQQAIATVVLAHTKTVSFEWHAANKILQYNDPNIEPGGVYYLMYDQDDLVGQAVKKNHNFNLPGCSSCGGAYLNNYNVYSRYASIQTVKVPVGKRNISNDLWLWDISQTQHVPDNNFGLNLELTIKCDLTDFLVIQRQVYAFSVRDMITFKILKLLSNSTRQNGAQNKVDALARLELQAKYAGGMGFMEQLENQLKAVDISISDLDDTCMPCAKKSGLAYGTASLSGQWTR